MFPFPLIRRQVWFARQTWPVHLELASFQPVILPNDCCAWILCFCTDWISNKAFWTLGNPAYRPMADSQQCDPCLCSQKRDLGYLSDEIQCKEGWRGRCFICCRHHPHQELYSKLQGTPETELHGTTFSSTSSWQYGIKVQIRTFSYLLGWHLT